MTEEDTTWIPPTDFKPFISNFLTNGLTGEDKQLVESMSETMFAKFVNNENNLITRFRKVLVEYSKLVGKDTWAFLLDEEVFVNSLTIKTLNQNYSLIGYTVGYTVRQCLCGTFCFSGLLLQGDGTRFTICDTCQTTVLEGTILGVFAHELRVSIHIPLQTVHPWITHHLMEIKSLTLTEKTKIDDIGNKYQDVISEVTWQSCFYCFLILKFKTEHFAPRYKGFALEVLSNQVCKLVYEIYSINTITAIQPLSRRDVGYGRRLIWYKKQTKHDKELVIELSKSLIRQEQNRSTFSDTDHKRMGLLCGACTKMGYKTLNKQDLANLEAEYLKDRYTRFTASNGQLEALITRWKGFVNKPVELPHDTIMKLRSVNEVKKTTRSPPLSEDSNEMIGEEEERLLAEIESNFVV